MCTATILADCYEYSNDIGSWWGSRKDWAWSVYSCQERKEFILAHSNVCPSCTFPSKNIDSEVALTTGTWECVPHLLLLLFLFPLLVLLWIWIANLKEHENERKENSRKEREKEKAKERDKEREREREREKARDRERKLESRPTVTRLSLGCLILVRFLI